MPRASALPPPCLRGRPCTPARGGSSQRTEDLRLVVDGEDPRHSAARSRATIVSPPPGVSSASSSPPIASMNPFATARPSPTPSLWPASPRRWNGLKRRSRSSAGTPRPRSTTRMSTVPSTTPARHRRRHPGRRKADRVRDHVGECALEEPAIGEDTRQRVVDVESHGAIRGAEAGERRREHLVQCDRGGRDVERSRLQPAHVEEIADERVEPVGLLLDRGKELVACRGRPSTSR